MINLLLKYNTRAPLIRNTYLTILRQTYKLEDPVIKNYLQRAKKLREVEDIQDKLNTLTEFRTIITSALQGELKSMTYLVSLSYGQIPMTPRHDHFIQAKYLNKLPFGKTSTNVMPPKTGYIVQGAAPLPKEFREHLQKYIPRSAAYKNLKSS